MPIRVALLVVVISIALAGACMAAPDSVMPAPSLNGTSVIDLALLAAHNRERTALNLPLLQWDAGLAAAARNWGLELTKIGALAHAPDDENPDQGENLWMGTRRAYRPEQMVAAWLAEKAKFRYGALPKVSTTGDVEDVGHYTQIVWRATRSVGCAIVADRDWDYLVCRYSPAGNYDGEYPY